MRSGDTKTRHAASHSSESSSRRIASARVELVRSTSSTRSSGRPRKVVHEPPLIGHPRLGPISGGWLKVAPPGITPPAIATPFTSGAGYVSGMFAMTTRRPACESSSGQVGARIDRDETGIRRLAPGWCSRMSNTPWPAGSRPVRKVGHAAQECDGVHDRETPRRPRSTRRARCGRSPAASSGSRMSQSAPSHPTTSIRFATGAEDTRRCNVGA